MRSLRIEDLENRQLFAADLAGAVELSTTTAIVQNDAPAIGDRVGQFNDGIVPGTFESTEAAFAQVRFQDTVHRFLDSMMEEECGT